MAQVIVTESSLQNIAGAIRSKLGTQDTYKPSEMAGAIAQIHGAPVLEALTANANGTYTPSSGKDGFSQAVVNVPNSYASGDEGKVVSNGALVAQSSQSINANGTYDTTLKNQVNVSVPNSYSASDEGKVVSNGALVAQSSQSITQNGTYDTTLKNQVVVNVSGGGGGASVTTSLEEPQSGVGSDGDIWVQYAKLYPNEETAASVTLTLVIEEALRGSSPLTYAGAAELDVIWVDENDNEISMRELSDFTYTRFSSAAFDNNPFSYWETNPTPITATMTATIPAGYKVKELKVMRRSESYTTDVWKSFYLAIDTTKIMEYENMSVNDWAATSTYTVFSSSPQIPDFAVVNTWININGEWVSPAHIDITIS